MGRVEREAAYVDFVVARQTALRRAAYAICGDWHVADDLLQTAFTKLYVAWPRLQRSGGEDAYVRRILLTSHIDRRRRAATRHEVVGLGDLTPGTTDLAPVDTRDELVSALLRLPEMQRKVVVLRQVLDLSVEQTASDLGISAGTVKSHHSRALARLRQLLEPAHPTTQEVPR